jgi:hypothetical protein
VKTTWYVDNDGDGAGSAASTTQACAKPEGYAEKDTDCDDSSAAVHPGAAETCNQVDDDCDGTADDGLSTINFWIDADGDGYGKSGSASVPFCSKPAGYSTNSYDCDDSNAAVSPAGTESCNSLDDNCDGIVDEGVKNVFYKDDDDDGYGSPVSTAACTAPAGYTTKSGDCDDSSATTYPGAGEQCNARDDNCNGLIDDGVVYQLWFKDADGDGYGSVSLSVTACAQPEGYVSNRSDCDDADKTINPAATEVCDSIDNNCDGRTDDSSAADAKTWYRDADGDGYGNPANTTMACAQPSGYLADATDCDDTNRAANPAATEACNGFDDNCDGKTDDASAVDAKTYYKDGDGDG